MNTIGKAIRIVRQAKDLRANQVAATAGISVAFLSLVENGKRSPSMDVLERIAAALHIPFDTLLLMGSPPQSQIRSDDAASQRLVESIRELARVESELSALLDK